MFFTSKVLPLVFGFIITVNVFAAGYEKNIQWGAETSSKAGAVASSVSGADAIFFNPAGLASGIKGGEVSVNVAPTVSYFEAPIYKSQQSTQSETLTKFPFGVLSSYSLSNKLGVGVGIYSAAGTGSKYEAVDYSAVNPNFASYKPDIEATIAVIEMALGLGYKFNKNWSAGAALRADYVTARLSSAKVYYTAGGAPASLVATTIEDLEQYKLGGVKIGGQYVSDNKNWGMGLVYRSQVTFKAKGKNSGKLVSGASGSVFDLAGGDAYIKTTLPTQLSFGGHAKLTKTLTMFSEYTWTDYSKCNELLIDAKLNNAAVGFNDKATPNIKQKFKDMHNIRLAAEKKIF